AINLLEDRRDAADAEKLNGLAESLDGCEVREAVLRAEICNLEDLLERSRAGHQFTEDGADGVRVERALARLQDVFENFLFPSRRKGFGAVIVFYSADLGGQVGPLVNEFEDLQVEFVDLGTKMLDGGSGLGRGHAVRSTLRFTAHDSTRVIGMGAG